MRSECQSGCGIYLTLLTLATRFASVFVYTAASVTSLAATPSADSEVPTDLPEWLLTVAQSAR